MNFFKPQKKLIGISFFVYLGGFYAAMSLFINDKLRNEMKEIEKKGLRKSTMLEIHDRKANSYEKNTEAFEFRNQIHKYRRILLSYVSGEVLECGLGTGKSLEFYKPNSNVIAIDHSENMIKKAYEKLENKDLYNINPDIKVEIKQMNCENLEFADNSFDTVVDINNFHTYSNPEIVFNNIKRVLKNDGVFLFLARGESDYFIIKLFYKVFKPTVFMKTGQDLTINWSDIIENDKQFEILYKMKKNYGRTYIYILKLHKDDFRI